MAEKENISCILVDDEEEAIYRLKSLLKYFKRINIVTAETCTDTAIAKIIKYAPDIVFTDVEMNEKSGFDVVKEVRANKIFPTFIFITGYNQYAIKAIKNAAFDYLIKPVDIDELSDTLKRYEKQRRENRKTKLPQKLKNEFSLTNREIEILMLISEGKTSKEIAAKLFISKHTVNTHRRNILGKSSMQNIAEILAHY